MNPAILYSLAIHHTSKTHQSVPIASFQETIKENTMYPSIHLIILVTLCLLHPTVVFSQTLGHRMNQLSIDYHALMTDTYLHNSYTKEPYSQALRKRLITVQEQMQVVIREIGCLEKREPDFLCSALLSEEKGLEWEILSADSEWC